MGPGSRHAGDSSAPLLSSSSEREASTIEIHASYLHSLSNGRDLGYPRSVDSPDASRATRSPGSPRESRAAEVAALKRKRRPIPQIFCCLGIFFLLGSAFIPGALEKAIDQAVYESIRLDTRENLYAFEHDDGLVRTEEENGDSLELRFYMYDITNAKSALEHGDQLNVVEKGPFVYRVTMNHVQTSFWRVSGDPDPFEVSRHKTGVDDTSTDFEKDYFSERVANYKTWQKITHIPNAKGGGMDDSALITTINVPFHIAVVATKSVPTAIRNVLLDTIFDKSSAEQEFFTTRTVREHIFGYDDMFNVNRRRLDAEQQLNVSQMAELMQRRQELERMVLQNFVLNGGNSPSVLASLRYPGFVFNATSEKELDERVGFDAQRVDRVGMHVMHWWQGGPELRTCPIETATTCCPRLWGTRDANRVGGSDGKFFHAIRKRSKNPRDQTQVWMPELYKRVNLLRGPDVRADGLVCSRWILDPMALANTSVHPSNAGYYADHQPGGLHNMSALMAGFPVFVSLPRFLHAPDVRVAARGVPPASEAAHQTWFDVHDETGISVKVYERFQFNFMFKDAAHNGEVPKIDRPYAGRILSKLSHLKMPRDNSLLPMFWFETIESMSNSHREDFHRVDVIVAFARAANIIIIALGLICVAISSTVETLRLERDMKRKQAEFLTKKHLEIHFEPGHQRSARYPTWSGELHEEEMKSGLALILSSPRLTFEWALTPFTMYAVNVFIEYVSMRGLKEAPMWSGGINSVAAQLVVASFLNGIFSVTGADQSARRAFLRGDFHRKFHAVVPKRFPYQPYHEPLRWRNLWTLPFRLDDRNVCLAGLPCGFTALFFLGIPVLLLVAFLQYYYEQGQTLKTLPLALTKASIVGLEGAVFFPLAALRTLDQEIDPSQHEETHPYDDDDPTLNRNDE